MFKLKEEKRDNLGIKFFFVDDNGNILNIRRWATSRVDVNIRYDESYYRHYIEFSTSISLDPFRIKIMKYNYTALSEEGTGYRKGYSVTKDGCHKELVQVILKSIKEVPEFYQIIIYDVLIRNENAESE